MNKSTIWLRSAVRRAGLIEPLLKMTRDRHEVQLDRLRQTYRNTPVQTASARIAGHEVAFNVSNETDYTIVKALREEAFTDALFDQVRPGDTVWDVGGNIGFVSVPLGKAVEPSGKVFAFEPVPTCRTALQANLDLNDISTVEIVANALADRAATVNMVTDSQVAAGTHHIAEIEDSNQNTIEVDVTTGDDFLRNRPDSLPQLIKIDIEGFEFDALRGMSDVMKSPDCRAIFIEVHFGLLDARGQKYAPLHIKSLLKEAGYKVSWIDRSHLAALRP